MTDTVIINLIEYKIHPRHGLPMQRCKDGEWYNSRSKTAKEVQQALDYAPVVTHKVVDDTPPGRCVDCSEPTYYFKISGRRSLRCRKHNLGRADRQRARRAKQ